MGNIIGIIKGDTRSGHANLCARQLPRPMGAQPSSSPKGFGGHGAGPFFVLRGNFTQRRGICTSQSQESTYYEGYKAIPAWCLVGWCTERSKIREWSRGWNEKGLLIAVRGESC